MAINLVPNANAISATLNADFATLSAESTYNMALGITVLSLIYPDYGAIKLLVPDSAISTQLRSDLLDMEVGQSLGNQSLTGTSNTISTIEIDFTRTSLTESGAVGTYGYVTAFNTASGFGY